MKHRAALLGFILLAGCASDPRLQPTVPVQQPAPDALALTLGSEFNTDGQWPAPDWVQRYQDPQLDRLVSLALQQNPSLQVARSRIDLAQSQLDQFASLAGLSASAGGAIDRVHLPQSTALANANVGGQNVPVEVFGESVATPSTLFAGVRYQFDTWGRNAALTEGLLSRRDAARVDAEQARLTLTVTIVKRYLDLERLYELQELLDAQLAIADQVEELLRERMRRGLDIAYPLEDAAVRRERIKQERLLAGQNVRLTELQLGVLSGQGAESGLNLARPAPAADSALALPKQLASDLLGRRPDIEAARLRVEAGRTDVAATRAAFYPNVDLLGFAGLNALSPGALLSRNALTLAAGPAFSLPIFNRGQLRGQLQGDLAAVDVAIGLYNRTLSEALGEVAEILTRMRGNDTLQRQQAAALTHATRLVEVIDERVSRGLAAPKDLLLAKLQLSEESLRGLTLRAEARNLRVALIGALGGGFDSHPGASPADAAQLKTSLPPQAFTKGNTNH